MEECVYDRNNNKNEEYDEEKYEGETTDSESTTMDEGKGVIHERGGKDVDLDEFDESTCSGDRYYDIFDKEEYIITEGSMVWVNTNKTVWEGRFIKIPFSDVPEDAKHLKLIRIHTKKEGRVLIKIVPKNINTKGYLYQLRDTRMEGLWRNQCWIFKTS